MIKNELRKLRKLPATKTIMRYGLKFEEKTERLWSGTSRKVIVPEYEVLLRAQNLDGYIKIAIFFPNWIRKGITTPRYELFINKAGEEWITRELDENGNELRWLTAMVCNLGGLYYSGVFYYYGYETKIYANRDTAATISSLGTESKNILRKILMWQQDIRENRIELKEQKEKAPWDADMKLVPEVSKNFSEWMRKDVCSKFYIFYKYSRNGTDTGYCSRCRKIVKINNPKQNKKTRCPSCRANAIFKPEGKVGKLSTGTYYADMIQEIEGGIVIRRFCQYQNYNNDYKNPRISNHEFRRAFIFDDGKRKNYEFGKYKNKEFRWIPGSEYYDSGLYMQSKKIKLYRKNFKKLKQKTLLKHSAIDEWKELPMSAARYLIVEKGNPAVEMLARMGMFKLAKEIIAERYDKNLFNQDATEISKILKIDKARLKRLKEMDANIDMLRWMQYEKMNDTVWPAEMIMELGESRIKISEFNFLMNPIKYQNCYNYLKKQSQIIGENFRQTFITWRDYINMADQMKMNTEIEQIQKPKNLKRAHDELVLLSKSKGLEKQAKELEKKWPKVNSQLPKLKKFEFTSGDYSIVAPDNILDIVKEGVILSHCVHTCDYYFQRIQTDESYLFFLRKSNSPDMPWYTIEVEPSGNIRQKRTTGDNQNPDFEKAKPFLKKWQKFFAKQLTDEEKELGEKADKLRKENYAELRKNGNKVWHGKLAGQLLADVLEADFMQAI